MSECIEKKEYSKPNVMGRNSQEIEGFIPAIALAAGLAVGVGLGSMVSSDLTLRNAALGAV